MGDAKIRLLLVEDDKVDQMAFDRFVREAKLPYDYTTAGSLAQAVELLASQAFDLIIADYMLGDGTLFDLLEQVRGIPVIVTTGAGNEETAVKAMKSGACDYLIKDSKGHYLRTLPFTVVSTLKRIEAEKELANYREQLELMVKERTAKLEAEIAVRRNVEASLKSKAQSLEETNTALNLLLMKRTQDKVALEENVAANISNLILPPLKKLLNSNLSTNQQNWADIILSNIKEVVSGFSIKLASPFFRLSPTEIQVANFIKHGKRTKGIAAVLNISTKTVENHRQKIREKMGIKNKKINLATYLLSAD